MNTHEPAGKTNGETANGESLAVAVPFTVAVPTYRRGICLLQTLEDVFEQKPAPIEVLVLDQTESHASGVEERLASWEESGKIQWIRLIEPNLPAARNRAIRCTRTPVLIFLDDDVRLGAGFFAAHLRHYSEQSRVHAVTGRVLQNDHWPPYRKIVANGAPEMYLDFNYKSTVRRQKMARVSGCNHSVRVDFIRKIGGYDERFTGCAVYEDVDAGLRIWRAGGRIVYEPDACLEHLIEQTGGCRADANLKWNRLDEEVYLANYFLFKNFFPTRHFWEQYCLRHLRRFVFNARYLSRPWRMPRGFWVYLKATWQAWRNRGDPRYLDGQPQTRR